MAEERFVFPSSVEGLLKGRVDAAREDHRGVRLARPLQLKLCPVLVERNAPSPADKEKGCTFE